MKKLVLSILVATALYACGGGAGSDVPASTTEQQNSSATSENPPYDPERGEGKFTHVDIPASLDQSMAANGQKVYDVKCSSCHKTSDEKLVGPGWSGVTQRHKPEWILNFVTNTDAMIDKDPKAQAQLEICLVRMPNQNLSDDEARSVYEFMRKIDGTK